MQVYHLAIDGVKKDSLTFYRVREMIRGGEVDAKTLAWTQGMDSWRPLGEISEFQKVFNEEKASENQPTDEPTAEETAGNQQISRQKRREPWKRLAARTIDIFIFSSALIPVFLLVPRSYFLNPNIGIEIISLPLMALFCSTFEALLFSRFGNTVGKWAFGISVKDRAGNSLSFKLAFQRSLLAWVRGMGLLIPFVAPVAMLLAHARLLTFGTTSWDRDLKTKVEFKQPTTSGKSVALLIYLTIGITVYFEFQANQRRLEEQEKKEKAEESKGNDNSKDDSQPDQNPPAKPDDPSKDSRNLPPLEV